MFKRLFRRDPNRAIAEALYEQIVAAARQAPLYSAWDVPDTPLGRYEMLGLHLFLLLHRLKGDGQAADALGQELVDTFVVDVDHSLRELGIGDMGIPKRMKSLSRMFYGRAASYGEAIDANDHVALAAAIHRNIRPDAATWPHADNLATYVLAANATLAGQDLPALLAGEVAYPEPAG